jgi:hypothetical protein
VFSLLFVLHTSCIVGLSMFVYLQVEEPHGRTKKNMSDELRKQVYQALLARSKNGILGKKDTKNRC